MKKVFITTLALVLGSLLSLAQNTVTGNLKYQDYKIDLDGYTGTTQLLPVRHAKIRVLNASNQQIGSGFTDANGNYSISFTAASPMNIYLVAATEGDVANGYPVYVADTLKNGHTANINGLPIISTYIDTVLNYQPNTQADAGNSVILAKSTVSVAQAFNVFDCGIDAFKWAESTQARNKKATASELLVYEWSGTRAIEGAYYTNHTIRLGTPVEQDYPTSGYGDMVILHETGHFIDDVLVNFATTDPGGTHYIGDNFQDPELSWGEGWPTFIAGAILNWKLSKGEPISPITPSMYSDMGNPPSWPPAAGSALNFSYDFEVGYDDQQRGTANEINVTTALWDIIDSEATADLFPGVDDESLTQPMSKVWAVFGTFKSLNKSITMDDFWKQWFILGNGADAQMKSGFADHNLLPYHEDSSEPSSNNKNSATPISAIDARITGAMNGVVINEIEVGANDALELFNTTNTSVDISGWKIQTARNPYTGVTNPTNSYTIPNGTTIAANSIITVYENGSAANNTATRLFMGSNIFWDYDSDGACSLVDASNNGVDFVKWGGNTNLPIPSGTSFTGTLNPPTAPNSLQRAANGSDSNQASDWQEKTPTLEIPNIALVVQNNTFYPENDIDYFKLKGQPGETYQISAFDFYSATLPKITLESEAGTTISSVTATSSEDALFLNITLPDSAAYYIKIVNTNSNTLYGEYSLAVLQTANQTVSPFPPTNISYTSGSTINFTWTNGSPVDSVTVYKNNVRIGYTTGNTWSDTSVPLNSYANFGFQSWKNGTPSNTISQIFVINGGALSSYANFFETPTELQAWDIEGTWGIEQGTGVNGSNAITDSPGSDYDYDTESWIDLKIPILVTADNKLVFSHVALIEPGDEYGEWDYGLILVSKKGTDEWIDVTYMLPNAKQSVDYPEDRVIDARMYSNWLSSVNNLTNNIPPLYKTESIKLSSIDGISVGDTLLISFYFVSDSYYNYDGWYIDNVGITTGNVVSVHDRPEIATDFYLSKPYPNPFNPTTTFKFSANQSEPVYISVYNLLGQHIRTLFNGTVEKNSVQTITWDGLNNQSQSVASGLYIIEMRQGSQRITQKALMLK